MELFGLKNSNGKEYKLIVCGDENEQIAFTRAVPTEERPKFKVGDWITNIDGWRFCRPPYRITEIKKENYGGPTNHLEIWSDNTCLCSAESELIRFATPQEIADHLRGICDIKYVGKNVFPVGMSCDYRIYEWHSYDSPNDRVYYVSSHGMVSVYSKGLFADLAPEKKKLPRTKKECFDFIFEWEAHSSTQKPIAALRKFLEGYED